MLNNLPAYKTLSDHQTVMATKTMADMFLDNPKRFDQFNIKLDGLLLDYSKHIITDETINHLTELAAACNLESWRDKLFAGAPVNNTENRAALHHALRVPSDKHTIDDKGENIIPFILETRERMKKFSEKIRSNKAVKTIINIGIGGSGISTNMTYEALKHYHNKNISVRFVSNIDKNSLDDALQGLKPEETFFIIASKTFTTQETITNAQSAKKWIEAAGLKSENHFAAITSNNEAAADFGINKDHIFPLKDWIGGRFSLWSAIGLPLAVVIGYDNFSKMLDGAHAMDNHFQNAPLNQNIPVIMGLLNIWYRNFWHTTSQAILPYSERLHVLPLWLQQLEMESNGKQVDRDGKQLPYKTGIITIGQKGTNGQHAFHQLIHQGTDIIPCDFIGIIKSNAIGNSQHQNILLAHMLGQSKALMEGQKNSKNPEKNFPGNRPSSTILLDELTPYNLGMLLALYEHRIFVEGIIWNINSFDQMGVELGKTLAKDILSAFENDKPDNFDSSTNGLLNAIKSH